MPDCDAGVLPDQAPLADLYTPNEASTSGRLAEPMACARQAWAAAGGERSLGGADLRCVLPLPRIGMWPWQVCILPASSLLVVQHAALVRTPGTESCRQRAVIQGRKCCMQ
jgi:hypothetical protein